ncbi:1-acyl-sn-glycerol-3-phosphate acyltransferase [Candidatus Chlorohelix sp.]|uniref:1-acyl-sn-glycerol-3-phosphate acyltransferase n=1 Tax=Candidatus Chlorohelix sp. TaxID=3139201 RepID=UPI003047C19D
MTAKSNDKAFLHAYYAPKVWWRVALFWVWYTLATIIYPRLSSLVFFRRLVDKPVQVEGLENLPTVGSFVLTANHYRGAITLDVIAAIYAVVQQARPEFKEEFILVVGQRPSKRKKKPPIPSRLTKKLINYAYQRWSKNAVRITLGNECASIKALREWKLRVKQNPALVFPEGKARLVFGNIRPGAGRWLNSLGLPIIPVGVWWHNGGWHVRIGKPLIWSARSELFEVQLGLNIAALLPQELTGQWSNKLKLWQEVHRVAAE